MGESSSPEDRELEDNSMNTEEEIPPVFSKQHTHPEEYEEQRKPASREELEERAQQAGGVENIIQNLPEEMKKINKEHQPNLKPKPSPKLLEEVEEAIRTGHYGRFQVVEEEPDFAGVKSIRLKDPDSGEEFSWTPGMEQPVALYYVKDPETRDQLNEDAAADWLEKILRPHERAGFRLIGEQIRDSLTATISSFFDTTVIDPATHLPIPGAGITSDYKQRLISRAVGRIALHNSNIYSIANISELGKEMGQFNPEEYTEIFNTAGVKEATRQLIVDEGRYWRLDGTTAATRRSAIITHLQTAAGGGLNQTEAELALDLALKSCRIFGEASYYDGIVLNTASPLLAGLMATGNATADGWVHFEDANGEADYEAYANFMAEHWDEIDFGDPATGLGGSAASQGPSAMNRAFWYPIILQKPTTDNAGTAEYLRRYAYLWVNSATRFRTSRYPTRTDLVDTMGHISDDFLKWAGWFGRVGKANDNRSQLNEKGLESVLNMPLVDPNRLFGNDSPDLIPSVMENFVKAVSTYGSLGREMVDNQGVHFFEYQRAMAHLLRGILEYSDRRHIAGAKQDGFPWVGLTQKNMFDMISWAVDKKIITRNQGIEVRRQIQVGVNRVALEAASPHFGEAFRSGLGRFWSAITSGK